MKRSTSSFVLMLARRADPSAVAGTVVETVFQGSREQVMVRVGEAILAAHVRPTEAGAWHPQDAVFVSWSDEDTHIVASTEGA